MTGPKRMRPESAEADSELAVSYVVEPERRMSDLSVESAGSASSDPVDVQHAAIGIASLVSALWVERSTLFIMVTWWLRLKCHGYTTLTR